MPPEMSPEPRPILLGVAAYVAVAGWLLLLPPIMFLLLTVAGVPGPFNIQSDSLTRHVLGLAALLFAGYVTGRTASEAPMFNAILLGALLYLLGTLIERAVMASFNVAVPYDARDEITSVVQSIIATLVGGTAAQWQRRTRGARQLQVSDFSPRSRLVVLAVGIAPFLYLAAAYRP